MKQNENIEDIYSIDTNGLDLAQGIEEDQTVDLEHLIKYTNQKIQMEKKRTLRERFKMANNFVKAAVVAGVILVGGTTVTAGLTIAKYIPNMGVSHSENIKVLPVPYTTTVEVKGKDKKEEIYYLRIVGLSYDGKLLEMDLETNWRDKIYDEEGDEVGFNSNPLYLQRKDGREASQGEGASGYAGESITQMHEVFEVDKLEDYTIILPLDLKEENKFEIPLKDLTLQEAKEAQSVEQLGEVAKDQGLCVVAVNSMNQGINNIDFIQGKQSSDIIFEGIRDYVIKDAEGKEPKLLFTETEYGATPYLLFECDSEFKGTIEASKLQVSKKIDQSFEVELPKAGQKNKINKTISLDGMEVIIESISVDDTVDQESGGYWVEVEYELNIPKNSKYTIKKGTQIKNSVSYKDKTQCGYSYSEGKTWTNMVIPTESFEPGEMLTLKLDCIKELVLSGKWSWDIK